MRKIILKPCEYTEEELRYMFRAFSSEDRVLWTENRETYAYPAFCAWFQARLQSYYNDFFFLSRTGEDRVGFVYSYGLNAMSGRCHITCYLSPEYRTLGLGVIAVVQFMQKLFDEKNLHKIGTTVFEFNQPSLKCHNRYMHLDGVLREHIRLGGRYYDAYEFSVLENEFRQNTFVKRLLGRQ